MTEAEKKRRENVIEYVLYMFHQENIIRGCQMNIECLQKRVVNTSEMSETDKIEMMDWYKQVVNLMEKDNIEDRGHLQEVIELIGELSYVHNALINVFQDKEYIQLWEEAYPNLVAIEEKTSGETRNPIELCFNGIYGILVLKMKKQEIIPETLRAVKTFSDLLAYLGKRYHDIQQGNLRFPDSMNN